jgi:hypothetical protein
MIRIEGLSIASERLQKALRPAGQAGPRQDAATAGTAARNAVRSDAAMDTRTFLTYIRATRLAGAGTDRA